MRLRRAAYLIVLLVFAALVRGATPAAASTVIGSCSPSVAGDFNGDGASDLAIGVPLEDSDDGDANSGGVNVIYGGGAGPGLDETADNQFIDEATDDVPGEPEPGDLVGACLAAGNFDNDADGTDDLAIGAPGEALGTVKAGITIVVYGSTDGLDASKTTDHPGAQQWDQDVNGVPGVNETGDLFGSALAGGDFNNDGTEDLSIGGPGEAIGSKAKAGAIWEIFGDEGKGLNKAASNKVFYQDVKNVAGTSEPDDAFGSSLVVGNFDADEEEDLTVGIPGEDIGSADAAGAVQTFYGGSHGLGTGRDQLWTQDTSGIADTSEAGDKFGDALAAGNFDDDGDGADDLAVGVPGQDLDSATTAGAVHIIPGSLHDGLNGDGDSVFSQDDGSDSDGAEDNDQFGAVLNAADFDDDGIPDLAVGVPFEDDAEDDQGAVEMFAGTGDDTFLEAFAADGYITQDLTGADADGAEANDRFGSALASGDFDGEGDAADLIIGVPLEDLSEDDAGAIEELDDADPASAVLWSQDSTGVPDDEEQGDRFGSVLG